MHGSLRFIPETISKSDTPITPYLYVHVKWRSSKKCFFEPKCVSKAVHRTLFNCLLMYRVLKLQSMKMQLNYDRIMKIWSSYLMQGLLGPVKKALFQIWTLQKHICLTIGTMGIHLVVWQSEQPFNRIATLAWPKVHNIVLIEIFA